MCRGQFVSFKGIIPPFGRECCFDRQHLNWLHGSVLAHSKTAMFTAELPQWKKTALYYVDASE